MKAALVAASFALKRQIEKLLYHVTHTSRSLLIAGGEAALEATLHYSTNYEDNHLSFERRDCSTYSFLVDSFFRIPEVEKTTTRRFYWSLTLKEICFLNLPFLVENAMSRFKLGVVHKLH